MMDFIFYLTLNSLLFFNLIRRREYNLNKQILWPMKINVLYIMISACLVYGSHRIPVYCLVLWTIVDFSSCLVLDRLRHVSCSVKNFNVLTQSFEQLAN